MKKFVLAVVSTGIITPVLYSQEGDTKPNIVFILADDLGYGDLGCFGNKVIETPHIDALAGEGVTFTDCYAGASVSSPSRCCLMTGLHTGHARIRGNMCRAGGIEGVREGMGTVRRTNLQPEDSTLATILSNNGYVTCLVNKWHLDGFDPGAGPLDRGFDEFYGWLIREPGSHNYYPSVRYRNREEYIISENKTGNPTDHNTDRATEEALDFLRRNKEHPFFLYLAYNAPHVPLDAKSTGNYEKNPDLSPNDKSYAALITHMDECIGKVLKVLSELKIDKNTIVIFASDNGGAKAARTEKLQLNGKLRGWKGELYEGGIRVPLIIRMPDRSNAGKTSGFPCYFPDFMPTFAALTSSYTTLSTDGISLVPELRSPGSLNPEDRFLYWEQYPTKGIQQAVRWGNWKLICKIPGEPEELYNLKEDPEENNNLASSYPDLIEQMKDYMVRSHLPSENWPVEPEYLIY
jgi:Arylsulfatase A and related enzymes